MGPEGCAASRQRQIANAQPIEAAKGQDVKAENSRDLVKLQESKTVKCAQPIEAAKGQNSSIIFKLQATKAVKCGETTIKDTYAKQGNQALTIATCRGEEKPHFARYISHASIKNDKAQATKEHAALKDTEVKQIIGSEGHAKNRCDEWQNEDPVPTTPRSIKGHNEISTPTELAAKCRDATRPTHTTLGSKRQGKSCEQNS